MATNPMQAMPPEAQEAGGGYCIEIEVGADGSIRVSVESKEYEDQEHASMPEGMEEPEGQEVASIDEALAMAQQIFTSNGEMGGEPVEQGPKMDGEDEFTQGFKQVRGTPDEQMAARMGR